MRLLGSALRLATPVIEVTARFRSGTYAKSIRSIAGLNLAGGLDEYARRVLALTLSRTQHRRVQLARTRRYEPTVVYALAAQLKREGIELHEFPGPWRTVRRPLRRPGRNAERAIQLITNGVVEIAVDTAEHAADLSAS